MNKNLVELSDLMIKPFYICLTKEYRILLIQKALVLKKDFKQIAQYIGCHPDTLRNFMFLEEVAMSSEYLTKLLHLVELSPIDLEPHLCYIQRGCSNKEVRIRFPIKATPELSLLIAKTCGDGSVLSDWRFHYTNNQLNLIEEVINAVTKAIGETKPTIHKRMRKSVTYEVKFSSVVGFILHMLAAPKGYKINQSYFIPQWIMNGSLEVKSAFLRGLFDDESTVSYNKSLKSRRIVLCLGKELQFKNSLEYFLQQVKMLLFDFGINSNPLRVQTVYGDKLMMELAIYQKRNFEKFKRDIGFSHQNKSRILNEMISSYTNQHQTRDLILRTVYNTQIPLTTKQVADINYIPQKLAESHLCKLNLDGLVRKIKNGKNTWTR